MVRTTPNPPHDRHLRNPRARPPRGPDTSERSVAQCLGAQRSTLHYPLRASLFPPTGFAPKEEWRECSINKNPTISAGFVLSRHTGRGDTGRSGSAPHPRHETVPIPLPGLKLDDKTPFDGNSPPDQGPSGMFTIGPLLPLFDCAAEECKPTPQSDEIR